MVVEGSWSTSDFQEWHKSTKMRLCIPNMQVRISCLLLNYDIYTPEIGFPSRLTACETLPLLGGALGQWTLRSKYCPFSKSCGAASPEILLLATPKSSRSGCFRNHSIWKLIIWAKLSKDLQRSCPIFLGLVYVVAVSQSCLPKQFGQSILSILVDCWSSHIPLMPDRDHRCRWIRLENVYHCWLINC